MPTSQKLLIAGLALILVVALAPKLGAWLKKLTTKTPPAK